MGGSLCCSYREPRREKEKVKELIMREYGTDLPGIEHVFVLMLENRTFDNIFGKFMDDRYASGEIKPSKWDVAVQAGQRLYDHFNMVKDKTGKTYKMPVWSRDPATEDIMSIENLTVPRGDPAEKFVLLNRCLFLEDEPKKGTVPCLKGFAQQYYELETHDKDELGEEWDDKTDFTLLRSPAMHVYLPEQMGVFTDLASAFGLSDTYFSSAPCQTWPNRLFQHCGHCYGYVNNLADTGTPYAKEPNITFDTTRRMRQFSDQTIFGMLLSHDVEFAIYHGDWALSTLLHLELHSDFGYTRSYCYDSNFAAHVAAGAMPPFVWLEPQYLQAGDKPPNDMHPPHCTLFAQELVADVYNNLRKNEQLWSTSVFIVNTDEGVGIFDHVPPPDAPDPEAGYDKPIMGFIVQDDPRKMSWNPFTRYGTRIPCLIATPFVNPMTVMRPDPKLNDYPFDHASVIRTIFDLFIGPDVFLTQRDKKAPSMVPYFRTTCREDLGPKEVKHPVDAPSNTGLAELTGTCRGPRQCHNIQGLRVEAENNSDAHGAESVAKMKERRGQPVETHIKK